MARVRKTVTFKPKIFDKLDNGRGKKSFSTYVNEEFERLYKLDKKKKKKIK